ncbi:MAG TPA: class I SAM-dependent methyltransferase [Chloroflexota bacterium]|nr:class I SAM-dependent methyltransferase [Chloroflexota bacterium]
MTQQTEIPGPGERRAGHHWKEADRVAEYVQNTDSAFPEAQEVYGILIATQPFEQDAAVRILDIGSGHGVVAGALLNAMPKATAVGLDISEPMMAEGKVRMAPFGDRFGYHVGDFAEGELPGDLPGTFDLAVSSRAIHHLSSPNKAKLYSQIFNRLNDGGAFFNIDNMRPRDDYFRAVYRKMGNRSTRPQGMGGGNGGGSGTEHPDPVGEQLTWLRNAGFAHVDCLWKKLGRALIVGYKA